MKYLTYFLVTAFTGVVLAQSASGIGFSSISEAYVALRNHPAVEFQMKEGWVIAAVRQGPHSGIWSFTPKEHPAHPAVIKRNPIEKDGQVLIDMQVMCGAEKTACDKLVAEFKQLNELMAQELKEKSRKVK